MKLRVTQVTFMDGQQLVAGVPLDDQTKVVVASAPLEVAREIADALSSGVLAIVAEPPDEDIVEIREL